MPINPLRVLRGDSLLLVVDVQERLAPAIADRDAILARTLALVSFAARVGVPVLATEHAPERIGPLVAPLRERLAPEAILHKTRFCAADEPAFSSWLATRRRGTIVLAGMESHVCVLQTALELRRLGHAVAVAADATGSRAVRAEERRWALERMREAGCAIAGTETILFEWTGGADDRAFREALALVKALPDGG